MSPIIVLCLVNYRTILFQAMGFLFQLDEVCKFPYVCTAIVCVSWQLAALTYLFNLVFTSGLKGYEYRTMLRRLDGGTASDVSQPASPTSTSLCNDPLTRLNWLVRYLRSYFSPTAATAAQQRL